MTIGLDATIRIPFGFVKKTLLDISAKNPGVRVVDASAPVLVRTGEFLKVVNLEVNAGGIMVKPVLTLKPYFEAKDKLAVKIQKVQLHVAASPDVKAGEPLFDKEQVMAQVMDTLIPLIMAEVDKAIKAKVPSLKAADVLKLNYDRETWILHAEVSMRFIRQFLPADLLGDLHLNGFSFNDNTVFVQISTEN